MSTRRRFGRVRKLPSGRWQARYRGPDGLDRPADRTFATKKDAEVWLSAVETDLARGTWTNPDLGRVLLSDYAARWLAERPTLRPRTKELYEGCFMGTSCRRWAWCRSGKLTPAVIRGWHATLTVAPKPGPSTVAKAYRLLRSILATAVEDEILVRNPCMIRGAGIEHPAERPVASVAQVYALADAVRPRFRALVLLATFTGCRWGELIALTRRRVDLEQATVDVVEQYVETNDGRLHLGPPKSDAGRRTITIPPVVVPDLRSHLDRYAAGGPDGLVFCGEKGCALHRSNFDKATRWREATASVGVPGLRFHDLRHTGNTLAAATGASTRELMARMGHASARAALIYQHATRERDDAIAEALSDMVERARPHPGLRPYFPPPTRPRTEQAPER